MNKSEQLFSNALELLTHLQNKKDFVIETPIDVENIATLLDIAIEFDNSFASKDIVGAIAFNQDKAIIKINPSQNSYTPRRRFTLAHEIGHYCLHSAKSKKEFKDSQKTMSRTDSYWDLYESQANNFAAQLLMPEALIISEGQGTIKAYKEQNKAQQIPTIVFIETMADKFKVSSKAMEYRLKNIGIIK